MRDVFPRGWSKRRAELEQAVRQAPFLDLATSLAYVVENSRNPLHVRLDAARHLAGVATARALTTRGVPRSDA